MTLIRNERAKLTATWLNGLSVACFAVGTLSPTVQARTTTGLPWSELAVAGIWLAASFVLHLVGRFVLRSLRDP